jgi:hypothetical protein
MTHWGFLLLIIYVGLGVGKTTRRKAGRLALVVTVMVLGGAMVSYLRSTPTAVSGPADGASPSAAAAQPPTGAAP